ncbi:probable ATP-dependent RNA helicase DDX31 isoform X2 [Dreissena polymorpha]|nr:probable ATP-dependent RNA helicase DDX31 isoform X2 [Dreissena polymorpha]XP_052216865.1 probable ATP-dependent RNA helicase DDX31 isoform X2 [Dreissena polymorpha]XP_052216866.1 probable ATP-dependent RNA helicase DDX31 isoform X2 [Dreissena polymorpha]XP_052216867.1 probable ATP-dependent RNA helicase DDX31 isoform X2 [Dreissena polymorpha]XP_052216868.1 probable ATP-dependent RNA helicase DDX31 isoform X2 [Dreissena polymorpha]XP_052216869.1 probable ATP-dependent RNA helicase DDX31 iso
MVSNLEKLGYTAMTSVQFSTIPKLIEGGDLLVKSQTGSGKTMAYAIPIVENLARLNPKLTRGDGCRVVVLVPTRELALQTYDVFVKLLKPFTWIVPGCIMGGEKRKAEKARLRKGINILIATPGRLIDHIESTANMRLDTIKWLILDEADRLLDLGFEEKVAKIIKAIDEHKTERQTVLLSATLTAGVERLAGMSLKNPDRVAVDTQSSNKPSTKSLGSKSQESLANKTQSVDSKSTEKPMELNENFALPENLKQYFIVSPCKLRLVVLLTLILSKCKKNNKMKMIVFASTQDGVEFLYRLVRFLTTENSADSDVEEEDAKTSLDLFRLHGDMSQKDRSCTYQDFCTTKSGVLLCTDVAARGLHLPYVDWVVQYSCPAGVTDYIHRVGRTARAGNAGNAITFMLPSEIDFVKHLNQKSISITEMKVGEILQDVIKLVPFLPGMEDSKREIPRTVEEAATYLQNCCELHIKSHKEMTSLAKTAYQSFIRAYATYPHELKSIFHLRHLHLGHVAKTFGLRAAPTDMSNIPGVNRTTMSNKRKHDKGSGDGAERVKKKKRTDMSEFQGPLIYKKKAIKGTKLKHKKHFKKKKQ